mgnify:CR=1 FL=1
MGIPVAAVLVGDHVARRREEARSRHLEAQVGPHAAGGDVVVPEQHVAGGVPEKGIGQLAELDLEGAPLGNPGLGCAQGNEGPVDGDVVGGEVQIATHGLVAAVVVPRARRQPEDGVDLVVDPGLGLDAQAIAGAGPIGSIDAGLVLVEPEIFEAGPHVPRPLDAVAQTLSARFVGLVAGHELLVAGLVHEAALLQDGEHLTHHGLFGVARGRREDQGHQHPCQGRGTHTRAAKKTQSTHVDPSFRHAFVRTRERYAVFRPRARGSVTKACKEGSGPGTGAQARARRAPRRGLRRPLPCQRGRGARHRGRRGAGR